ncbi:hypothetical protein MKX03_022293 [Papaver bracteatum]|nr:hypothetical protein MKX03_022293 [Papaver bracteatum]
MGKHVVVMAFPYGSHPMPLLNLVRRLAIAAPTVTFSFFSTSKSNKSIFGTSANYIPSNIKPCDVDDGVPKGFKGHPLAEMNNFFLKSMADNYKKGIYSVYDGESISMVNCIISDSFLHFSGDMADQMGVPWIAFWGSGSFSLSTHYHTDLIRQSIALGPNGSEGREEEPIDFIPGLSSVRIKDLPEGVLIGDLESEFSLMLHKMALMLPRAVAVTMNFFPELDGGLRILEDLKSKSVKCMTLGPFTAISQNTSHTHNGPTDGCLTWLDQQKPTSVAYISLGTVATPPPHEFAALAEGLEESGVPFLWSLKDHLVSQLPNGFLERTSKRGLIVPWTPQERVLGHDAVGVFVTHCGWNSVVESIAAGVPMICRPFFGDHGIICRMISAVWGVGTMIKDGVFTKEGTMECLDMIFSDEKFRVKVNALRACAKHALGPEGTTTKNFNTLAEIVYRD